MTMPTPRRSFHLNLSFYSNFSEVNDVSIGCSILFIVNNNFIQTDDCYGYNKENVRSIKAKKHSKKQ